MALASAGGSSRRTYNKINLQPRFLPPPNGFGQSFFGELHEKFFVRISIVQFFERTRSVGLGLGTFNLKAAGGFVGTAARAFKFKFGNLSRSVPYIPPASVLIKQSNTLSPAFSR